MEQGGRIHGPRSRSNADRHPDTVCRILYWLEGDEVRLIRFETPKSGRAAAQYGVDVNTGILWVRCFRETGSVAPGRSFLERPAWRVGLSAVKQTDRHGFIFWRETRT